MTKEKSVHITLRMPLQRRIEFSVACDMLDVTMSKKLHKVITETIALAEAKNPNFHQLVEAALQEEASKAAQCLKSLGFAWKLTALTMKSACCRFDPDLTR